MTRFRKISRNIDFWPKIAIFRPFLPPERGQNLEADFFCNKVKLCVRTLLTSHHTLKLYYFLARYLQKNGQKPYNVTTCNVFLTKKGLKRPKPDFSRNFHLFFSKLNPKCSLCKIKKILWLDFEKLAETLIFGQKWPFFYQKGPKTGEKFWCHNFKFIFS